MIVTGPEVVSWVATRTNEFGNFGAAVGIGVERDGQLIAGVVYNEYNGVNCNMHVAAIPKSNWLHRATLWHFFNYPFNTLRVNRVTALVGEGNTKSRRLIEGVGFSLETTLEAAHPTGRLLIYRMFTRECRWIQRESYAKAA